MNKFLLTITFICISLTIISQNNINELIKTPVFKGDTIMVRDSSISYRYIGVDSVPFSKTINTAFNNSGMPVEIFYYSYNAQNQQFEPDTKVTNKYFDNSNIIEEIHRYEYNPADGTWHLVDYNLYDSQSNQLLTEYYGYDITYTNYISGSKNTYQYNEQFFLESITSEEMDINTQTLVNKRKIEYQRNENNNDTAVLIYNWVDNLWEVQRKTIKNYNGNQLVEEINFVPGDTSWVWTDKVLHTYDDVNGVDTATYYNWYEEYEFWYITNQHISKIISDETPLFVILRDYDFVTETWSDTEKTTWAYDGDILVNRMEESWFDDEWKPIHEVNYYYNSDEYIDSTISKYFNTFDTTYFSLENDYFNYNSDNTITSAVHFSKQLDNELTKTYAIYFYNSPFVTPDAINEYNSLTIIIYPNPAHDILSIKSDEKLKSYRIYNISGQLLISQTVNNTNEINININALQPGVYILKTGSNSSININRFIKN